MAGPSYGRGFIDLAPRIDQRMLGGFESSFVSKMGGVASMAGVALVAGIGAAVAAGAAGIAWSLSQALGQQDAARDAGARLGLSPEESKALGTAAALAYTDGWGESVEANTELAGEVMRRWGEDMGEEALGALTSTAAGLSDVFGEEGDRLIGVADRVFSNDLVKSAEDGFDLVTAVMQRSAVPDEALSALDEYAGFFRQLGFDATEALGGLTSEAATGQHEIDSFGDAVKEFGIRVIDGSALSEEALGSLGFSVDDVNSAFAKGGDFAGEMSADIIQSIIDIQDPVARTAAGVALMGGPFENLGNNAVPILQDMLNGVNDFGGAAGTALDASVGPMDRISAAMRGIKQSAIESIGGALVPIFENLVPVFETVSTWMAERLPGAIETLTGWFSGLGGNTSGLMTTFQTVWKSISGAVVVAVGIVGELLANMRQWFEENRETITTVMGQIQEVISTVTEIVSRLWNTWGETLMALASNAWTTISGVISGVLDVVIGILETFVGLFTGDWERMDEGLRQIWDGLWEAVESILEGAWGQVMALVENFPGDMMSAGEDVVTGFWEGIKSMGSWLAGQISDFIEENVSGVVDWVLGRGSPAKAMIPVGASIPQGLAVGMSSEEPLVRSAARDMARAAMPALSGARAGLATVTPITAGRGGGLFDGATFNQYGTPETLVGAVSDRVGLEVRAS